MTLPHSHRTEYVSCRNAHYGRLSIAGVARKISAAFKTMHRAIVVAKLRRLRNELMFHGRAPTAFDATKFPQRPLLLGDKWDF